MSKKKEVKPVWTAEVWWCHSIDFLCLSDNVLYFNAFVSDNDSLKDIDFETLNLEQKRKYIQIDENSKGHKVILNINANNGEYITTQDSCLKDNTPKGVCSCGKVFNPFKPNKCETEIVSDYKGYRITIEVKKYIWRTANNKSFAFKIYLKDKLVSKIPVSVFGSFITSKTSIYFNWGPIYRKQFISKYNFEDLIQ